MSSSRLPGKVLAPILGRPMLALQLERLRRATRLDALVVATSEGSDDDAIADCCTELGIAVHRGALDNVLDRYYQAALRFEATAIVRLTADCPLADPTVIDGLVAFFESGGFDYASNALQRTWPRGLDAEIMTFDTLETAWQEARRKDDLEHVTSFIYRHPDRFRLGAFTGDTDLSHLRLTVDYTEDLRLVESVYGALYDTDPQFSTADVVAFLDANPQVRALNSGVGTDGGPTRDAG